jgi:hypothetical protein
MATIKSVAPVRIKKLVNKPFTMTLSIDERAIHTTATTKV